MKRPHHSKLSRRQDGRWVVECFECRRGKQGPGCRDLNAAMFRSAGRARGPA